MLLAWLRSSEYHIFFWQFQSDGRRMAGVGWQVWGARCGWSDGYWVTEKEGSVWRYEYEKTGVGDFRCVRGSRCGETTYIFIIHPICVHDFYPFPHPFHLPTSQSILTRTTAPYWASPSSMQHARSSSHKGDSDSKKRYFWCSVEHCTLAGFTL